MLKSSFLRRRPLLLWCHHSTTPILSLPLRLQESSLALAQLLSTFAPPASLESDNENSHIDIQQPSKNKNNETHPSSRSSHNSTIQQQSLLSLPNFHSKSKGKSHQRGYGKIVAVSSTKSTNLTTSAVETVTTHFSELSHSSPFRLVPSRRSHPARPQIHKSSRQGSNQQQSKDVKLVHHEAALLHLSSYGGGLVPGDSLSLDIDVRGPGTVLCILTQGGTRIYRPFSRNAFKQSDQSNNSHLTGASDRSAQPVDKNEDGVGNEMKTLCKSTVRCNIEPGATLFYLPDPTVPYSRSSFRERRKFYCQYSSRRASESSSSMGSIIAVDWYSAGRIFSSGMEEERWAFDYLSTRTELFVAEKRAKDQISEIGHISRDAQKERPILIESMSFDNRTYTTEFPKASSNESQTTMPLTPAALALGRNFDAIATVVLHGPNSVPVANRAKRLSRHLVGLCTRIRWEGFANDDFDSCEDRSITDDDIDCNDTLGVNEMKELVVALGGNVLVSVTPVERNADMHGPNNSGEDQTHSQTHMLRILAENNEDTYRILHYCLKPCSRLLGGLEPYKDRIHSSKTARSLSSVSSTRKRTDYMQTMKLPKRTENLNLEPIVNQLLYGTDRVESKRFFDNENAWFRMCTLSDSSLPVGSFAHSLGIESASQLHLFSNEDPFLEQDLMSDGVSCSIVDLSNYVYSVARSNARFSSPLVLAGYSLLLPESHNNDLTDHELNVEQVYHSWLQVDDYVDTLLRSNGPGHRASMDQGLGLLRIASSFDDVANSSENIGSDPNRRKLISLWHLIRNSVDSHFVEEHSNRATSQHENVDHETYFANGHAAPIYGVLSSSLGLSPLDSCRVFSFGAARDVISAAVRLNLLGPMAGVSLLDSVGRIAVEEGLKEGILNMRTLSKDLNDVALEGEIYPDRKEVKLKRWLDTVATCAPLMDAVQPCHDMLSVRLFRT